MSLTISVLGTPHECHEKKTMMGSSTGNVLRYIKVSLAKLKLSVIENLTILKPLMKTSPTCNWYRWFFRTRKWSVITFLSFKSGNKTKQTIY
jgi:hypothetical protein